jgi:hypothetical protein
LEEEMTMTFADTIVTILVGVLLAGPLAWRVWRDRQEARALAVHADIKAAVDETLHGESFVAVQVTPETAWRPGRVLLSATADSDGLVQQVTLPVLKRMPPRYELVVTRPDPGVRARRRAA